MHWLIRTLGIWGTIALLMGGAFVGGILQGIRAARKRFGPGAHRPPRTILLFLFPWLMLGLLLFLFGLHAVWGIPVFSALTYIALVWNRYTVRLGRVVVEVGPAPKGPRAGAAVVGLVAVLIGATVQMALALVATLVPLVLLGWMARGPTRVHEGGLSFGGLPTPWRAIRAIEWDRGTAGVILRIKRRPPWPELNIVVPPEKTKEVTAAVARLAPELGARFAATASVRANADPLLPSS